MSDRLWPLKHALKQPARQLHARLDRLRHRPAFAGQLDDGEAAAWIEAALGARRPVLVGRLGAVEARLLGEARWRQGRFGRLTRRQAHQNAGIFPLAPDALAAVAERLGTALQAVDLLALWDSPYQAALVAGLRPLPQRCGLAALEPWWQPRPWSVALAGRRVLVVHPFAASIESQLARCQRLFANPAVLPDFELVSLCPPQTLAGATQGYGSWLAALDELVGRVSALDFDVALLRSTASWWLSKPQRSGNPITHSLAALPSRLDRELNRAGADLIHLHWLQDEFLSVEAIGRLRGPVVWTLHDTWAFCGSEHYPASQADRRFVEGYRRGNRLAGDWGIDLDRWVWRRKQRAWAGLRPRLQLIAPSRWMAEQVAASALLAGVPCAVIPIALPEVFRPISRPQARELLGWPQQRRLILFGAIDGAADPRKGWDLLEAALGQLAPQRPDLEAVVLGQSQPAVAPRSSLPLRYAGRLRDDLSLALAYAAADVVVVPSRLDNLPQSASEALACGTPVVAFRQGGMADLVEHRRSGWLAQPGDVQDLARGIAWCLDTPAPLLRSTRLPSWRPAAVAQAHGQLYRQLLAP